VPDFATSVERLLNQVRVWEQPRWSLPALGQTRADLTYALVQRLADLGADAEGRAHRPVPREHDMILPDQLRVTADDLLAARPPDAVLQTAMIAVDAVRDTFTS
jgi:hypothetical protein